MSIPMLTSGKEDIGKCRSADAKVRGAERQSSVMVGIHKCWCSHQGPLRFLPPVPIRLSSMARQGVEIFRVATILLPVPRLDVAWRGSQKRHSSDPPHGPCRHSSCSPCCPCRRSSLSPCRPWVLGFRNSRGGSASVIVKRRREGFEYAWYYHF